MAELYRSFFDAVASTATVLIFSELEWRAAEVRLLIKVLPRFIALTSLDLSRNRLDAEAGKALADALLVNGSLTSVWSPAH